MALDFKAIGERIKTERKRKGLTQEKLAELAGLSNQHISNIENEHTHLGLSTLVDITNALDITPDTLLCDNIKHGKDVFMNDILIETQDCSELEIRIIADTVRVLKHSIRNRTASLLKEE